MKITVLTLFPSMFSGFLTQSIVGRAQKQGAVELAFVDMRAFAKDSYGTVDDRPYGGGAGMVIRVDILYDALKKVLGEVCLHPFTGAKKLRKQSGIKIVLTSAKGNTYSQAKAEKLSKINHLVLIAGHYEGVDERALAFIDEEMSIGQYVLTGGELPAAVIADSVVRLLPGVLKKEDAARQESFSALPGPDGKKSRVREHPHYTRPADFMGMKVPEILMSGDHRKIAKWRQISS